MGSTGPRTDRTAAPRTIGRCSCPPPALALQRQEAAQALGVGVDTFDRHIRPHLAVTRTGALRLYSIEELNRWLRDNEQPAIMAATKRPRAAQTAGGMAPGGQS